jgi:hypothetical protein
VNPFELVRTLRGGTKSAVTEPFDRVATGYQLNEALTSRPVLRATKSLANWSLNLMRLGDSLKVRAT